ncbi:hypothetical protein OF83DRAFT_364038 [Amylostereum chailletii]|nr:hypothetical protein OF83DRAFT_364038 [Amylostereum chailletii]
MSLSHHRVLFQEASQRKGKRRNDRRKRWHDGELRQTANRLVNNGKNGEDGNPVWRLLEIIGDKSQVESAIISSYAVQVSWIYQFFLPSTPVIIVAQPAPTEINSPTVKEILPS